MALSLATHHVGGMSKPLFIGPEPVCFSKDRAGTSIGEPYGSEEGRRGGEAVCEMIGEALAEKAEDRRVRALGECVRRFPRETLRHPDVVAYLEHLSRRRDAAALTRILSDRPRRGRPARSPEEEFTETAIMEGIIAREGCSARQAAKIARRDHPDLFGLKSERTIQNDYSGTRDAYRVWRQPRWIPGDKLTEAAWSATNRGRPKR